MESWRSDKYSNGRYKVQIKIDPKKKFAKNCLKVNKFKKMFPKNLTKHDMSKRNFEFYRVNRTLTERYMNSAIPQMQRMLNSYQDKKIKALRQLNMPVNLDLP